ncbi:MAG: MATE family efflux transporter [Lachnospiraceae bacterium]|nr:MATE family efflux transporter [Lachnospiraceae bacterium]
MEKRNIIDKDLFKKTLLLAVPIMIQNGIGNAVGLVDNIMVGSQGTEAIVAVSVSGQLMFVFWLLLFGAMSGPGIFGAQYYGNGDIRGVQDIFRIKMWGAIICTVLGVLVFLNLDTFLIGLYMKGQTEEGIDPALTMSLAKEYLRIMVIGIPFITVTQVYATSLRETDESFKPMIAGVISVFTDVIFNYLLIFGHFGFPKLGVAGAAYATVIARITEFFVLVVWAHLRRKKHVFLKGIYSSFKINSKIISPVLKKSIPIMLNEFLWAGAIAFMTQCYSVRGLDVLAGINISNAICNLLNVVFIALGNAVGIVIGQMLGAMEFEKAKKSSVTLMWFTAIVCLVLTAILIGVSWWFPTLYDTSDSTKHMATLFIIITACFFPLQGFLNSLYFTLRSGGKTIVTFIFDSVFSWTVCASCAYILAHFTNLNIFGIYIAVQSMDIIKVIIGYIMIKKGIWISNLVIDDS